MCISYLCELWVQVHDLELLMSDTSINDSEYGENSISDCEQLATLVNSYRILGMLHLLHR